MAIELRTFASGDVDYIAKLNANVAALEQAINALQQQAGAGGAGSAISAGFFLDALFNHKDALIGVSSYKPLQSATGLTVAPGAMYLADVQTVVQAFTNTVLNFTGAVPGFYYVVIDGAGTPTRRDTREAGSAYQVDWRGNGFYGYPVLLAPTFYDTAEAEASRHSTQLPTKDFATLDHRLEMSETYAKEALQDANQALAVAYEVQAAIGGVSYRKIGCTVDGTTGIKGAIQIDFEGTIVGWSVIADTVGSLSVEVSRKASGKPPAVPQIPNTTTDKITASAPIQLTNAQSAARSDAGVSTWLRDLEPWDVIQFNVISVNLISRATLYLQIFEMLPSPPEIPQQLPVWLSILEDIRDSPPEFPSPPDSPPDFDGEEF
jgi:hypothetical protein